MPKKTVQQRAARIVQRQDPERWKYTAALREVQRREAEDPGYSWRLMRADMAARSARHDDRD